MFVNYRVAHSFRQEEERNIIRTFANLAGLVVQKVQWQHRQAEERQQELVRLTHDDLMAKIDGAARSVSTVLSAVPLSPVYQAHLENSLGAIEESQAHLRFLTDTFRAGVSEDFLTELEQVVTRISTAWNTQIELKYDPECRHLPDRLVEPLLDVLTEALRNAASYSKAATITVELKRCATYVRGTVQDNGRGFNPRFIRPRGLETIRRTVTNLGGTYEQVTSRGEGAELEVGTRIIFTVPVEDLAKEGQHARA
jgi:signal transduction histidine kinase